MSAADKLTELINETRKEQTRPYGQYIAEKALESHLVNNASAIRDLIVAAEVAARNGMLAQIKGATELHDALAKLKEPT